MKKRFSVYMIIVGCRMFGFAVNYFVLANNLAEGGFTGIGLLLYYQFGIPLGVFFIFSNLPLVIIGYFLWGKGFTLKTILGVAVSSLAVEILAPFQFQTDNLLLAAIYGGLLSGAGLGIVMRYGGTTGGNDILARIIQRYKGMSVGQFYLAIDSVILTMVALIHGLEVALYSIIVVYMASIVIDFILEGVDSSRQCIIITNHVADITAFITNEMHRGYTLLHAKGGYDKREKEIIFCVVGRREMFELRKAILKIDAQAFIIIGNVREIYGLGFKERAEERKKLIKSAT